MYSITSKSGKEITLRPPLHEDALATRDYINTLSREDTFITFSGEQLTLEDEQKFIDKTIVDIKKGDVYLLLAFHDTRLIGICGLTRKTSSRRRALHVADIGVSLASEYREDGIGQLFMEKVLVEGVRCMPGIRIVELTVYGNNARALELYKKLGFGEFGRLPEGLLYKNILYDMVYMYKKVGV